jgi:UDP-N-acetyl-D-galactosamine dehydrogenase
MQPTGLSQARIAVIGLGYVGLPLALELANLFDVLGFDISHRRVAELQDGHDRTREVPAAWLQDRRRIAFTSDPAELKNCNVYIVSVPTPIDRYRVPDLGPLLAASRTVGRVLAPGDVVIYESTVYPGATEEDCVPVLTQESGLRFNQDFTVGYSPERVNPGDQEHRIIDIVKVTSGSTPETADFVDQLYAAVVRAGTHRAPSIRVAEAAKVIENTQRDVNIGLINELAILFQQLGLDTQDVLAAAATKWNFLPFKPGLVGGHCIGIDPYYLTHKAQAIGYNPELILAGRRTNDRMGRYVADRVVSLMTGKRIHVVDGSVLVLGATFKENCPDIRNSQVQSLVRHLQSFHVQVTLHDPWADAEEIESVFGMAPVDTPAPGAFDAVVLAVAHTAYVEMGPQQIRSFGKANTVVYDIKGAIPPDLADERL